MDAADCQPDFCLDFDPNGGNSKSKSFSLLLQQLYKHIFIGHGRKRREIEDRNATEYTKFKENLEYTVIMPGEFNKEMKFYDSAEQCKNFVMISGLLAGLLALSTLIVSIKNKLHNAIFKL